MSEREATARGGDDTGVRRRANTRARLVEAAVDVFAAKGLDGASVDDLVTAAGFTRGAFYSNFASKSELFFAAHDAMSRLIVDAVRATLAALPVDCGPEAAMTALYEAMRPHGRRWYLLRTQANAAALRSEEDRAAFERSRGIVRGDVRDLLAEQYALVGMRPQVDLDDLAETVIGLYLALLLQENLDGTDIRLLLGRGVPAVFLAMSESWERMVEAIPAPVAPPAPTRPLAHGSPASRPDV